MPDTFNDNELARVGLESIDRPQYPRFVTIGDRGYIRINAEGRDFEVELHPVIGAKICAQISLWLAELIKA